MAHHPEGQYEEWLFEMTGLPLQAQIDTTDPPFEMLSVRLEGTGEVFRVPTRYVRNRDEVEAHVPPHLHVRSLTLDLRCRMLAVIRGQPDALARCSKELPAVRELQESIARSSLAAERRATQPTISSNLHESMRQVEEMMFRLDDATVTRFWKCLQRA